MRNEWDWYTGQPLWRKSHGIHIWCDMTRGWEGNPMIIYWCDKCGLRWTLETEKKNEVWDFCEED